MNHGGLSCLKRNTYKRTGNTYKYETKFKTLEKERSNALEVATKTYEERET